MPTIVNPILSPPVLQALLIAYCIAFVFFLTRPVKAAVLFIFFRANFQVAAFFQVSLFGIPYFVPPGLLLAVAAATALGRTSSFRPHLAFKFYGLFVLSVSFFCLIDGGSLNRYGDFIFKILFPVFIYVMVSTGVRKDADLYSALRWVSWSSLLPLTVGLLQLIPGGAFNYPGVIAPGSRIIGTIIDPNLYGIYISLSICMLMPLFLARRTPSVTALMLLMCVTFIAAKNRGSWLALTFALAVTLLYFRQYVRIQRWIGAAAVIGVLAAPVIEARFANLDEVDQYGQSQDTFSERVNHHIDLLKKSLDSPLIGAGVGSAETPIMAGSSTIVLPHNDYVRIAVEAGYISLLLYVCFLVSQVLATLRYRDIRQWSIQFGALMMQIYVIIISFEQNFVADVLSYSLFSFMLAISHRAVDLNFDAPAKAPAVTRVEAPRLAAF